MKVKQGTRTVTLTPQGHSQGNRLMLAGAEIHELDGRFVGFWHARDMPRETKRELLAELASHWMPPQYDPDALR